MRTACSTLFILLLAACTSGSNEINSDDSVAFTSENIPAERKNINPQPVKTYSEIVKSFETTDEFKIRLYETKQTFNYLMKISYKQIEVDDTLRVPNFGVQPSVEIVKGDSIRPSCIVGFFDKNKQFRETKLISFTNDKLKVKVLKHYAVFQGDSK